MNFLGRRTLTVCARQLLCPRTQRPSGAFAFGTLSEKKRPPKKERPGNGPPKKPRMPAEKSNKYQSPDPNLVSSVRKQILMNASEESRTLVQDIVKLYEEKGKTFVLPLADKKSMNLIACSFHNLLQIGLKRDFLIDACLKWEELFCAMTKQGTEFMKILPILAETTKWTFEDTMAFMAEHIDELLEVPPVSIEERLRVFRDRGIEPGDEMVKLIERCPQILYESDPRTMDQTLTDMTGFFSAKMIRKICHKSPFATLMAPSDLRSRCEYIHGHMGFEPEDFVDASGWALLDLREIMIRHDVLRKTGKYITPDEKRPQYKMDNPKMDRILDTDDAEFATKVVGITYEELLTFRELCEQIEANSDKEKPYERINAKQRKAFDRQEKPMPSRVPGSMEEFDVHHSGAE